MWWEPGPASLCALPSAAPWPPGPSQALGLPPRPGEGFPPGALPAAQGRESTLLSLASGHLLPPPAWSALATLGPSFSQAWGAPSGWGGGLISPAGLLRHTARNGDCPGHSLWTGQHPACFRPRGTLPGDPGWPAGDQVHGALGGAPCCPRALISPTPDTQRARPRGPATRPQPIPPHPRGSGRQPRPHAPAARPHAGLARSLQWAEHDRGLGRQSSCGSPSL